MHSARFGQFKRAKTFILRSRFVTTYGKGERLSKLRASMEKLCRPGRSRDPVMPLRKALPGCTKGTLVKFFALAGYVTNDGQASAKSTGRNRFRQRLITIYGAARRRKSRSCERNCITIGIGSGRLATE